MPRIIVILNYYIRVLASFLPEYQILTPYRSPPALAKKTRHTPELTVVLDLDETLVHSSITRVADSDHEITLFNGTDEGKVYNPL